MSETKKKVLGWMASVGLAEEVPDAAPAPRNTPVPGAPPRNTPLPPAAVQGTIDPEMLAKLEARLQKSCPAPYVNFMEQYENLKEVIPDEAMRFKAALKASHTTTDQLVDAVGQLIGVMDTAQSEFLRTFEENKTRQLGAAQTTLTSTDEQIASYEKQLQSIQETIATLRTKHAADSQAMIDKAHQIETVRANFEAAHRQVVSRLQAQKSRVEGMGK